MPPGRRRGVAGGSTMDIFIAPLKDVAHTIRGAVARIQEQPIRTVQHQDFRVRPEHGPDFAVHLVDADRSP